MTLILPSSPNLIPLYLTRTILLTGIGIVIPDTTRLNTQIRRAIGRIGWTMLLILRKVQHINLQMI
jgi:hypothetical protein